jgi:hypothetical protein
MGDSRERRRPAGELQIVVSDLMARPPRSRQVPEEVEPVAVAGRKPAAGFMNVPGRGTDTVKACSFSPKKVRMRGNPSQFHEPVALMARA